MITTILLTTTAFATGFLGGAYLFSGFTNRDDAETITISIQQFAKEMLDIELTQAEAETAYSFATRCKTTANTQDNRFISIITIWALWTHKNVSITVFTKDHVALQSEFHDLVKTSFEKPLNPKFGPISFSDCPPQYAQKHSNTFQFLPIPVKPSEVRGIHQKNNFVIWMDDVAPSDEMKQALENIFSDSNPKLLIATI